MRTLLFVSVAVCAAGCGAGDAGGPPGVPAPAYDPDAFAQAVLAAYDKNGNGSVEGGELDACPALKGAAFEIDANADKKLSREELRKRAEDYAAAGPTVPTVRCQVTWNGEPLEGAVVTFTPDPVMGAAFKPASATTDPEGGGLLQQAGAAGPGVPCGLYQVSVSKAAGGKDLLPTRFNNKSTLGREVYVGGRGGGDTIELDLTGR